jgi:hypothetical protein
MALSTFSVAPQQAADATFRLWGKGLSDAMTAAGLTKLSAGEASGQIDWATVAFPAAGDTSKGYEFWRFSDALHAAGSYVFIKIEYGSGTAATSPAIWVTIGTSHDGAGALTGLTTVRRQIKSGGNTATAYTCRVSGGTDRITVVMWADAVAVTYSWMFSIERTLDAAGANTVTGILFMNHYTSASQNVAYTFAAGVVSTETALPALLPSVGSGATGTAVAVYPLFFTQGVYFNPLANVIMCFGANFTPGTPVSFTYYGSTKAYMPISNAALLPIVRGTVGLAGFLVRNE